MECYSPYPPERYDFEIICHDPEYTQRVTLPTPTEPGVIRTTMTEPTVNTEDLSKHVFFSAYARDVGSILIGVGMYYERFAIYPAGHTQHWSRYEFDHPESYNQALATLSITQSDFQPPRIAVQPEGQHRTAAHHEALTQRAVAVNVHNADMVNDYEQRVPIWTFMSPRLFETICQKIEQAPANSEQAQHVMHRIDTLTCYEKLGRHIINMDYGDTRNQTVPLLTDAGFSSIEAAHLAETTEAYRRDVVRPLSEELRISYPRWL